ncbi:MAG: hypothetical protein OEW12_02130 [Deltaproteobacteria bacterium]|nr:hypothetical protein [Deltaproteobacteria bacterium]
MATSKWFISGLAAVILSLAVPLPTKALSPSAVNVYTMWIKLSLNGHSQEEIESLLRNMDPKTLSEVKDRLRKTVLSNLELRNIESLYGMSRDYDDLSLVMNAIRTEIRFAGLETDGELKLQIKNRFGIHMD